MLVPEHLLKKLSFRHVYYDLRIYFKTFNYLLQGDFGVYTKWVRENFNPDPSGAVEYEAWINAADQQGHIVRERALQVYKESMSGEAAFFGSV